MGDREAEVTMPRATLCCTGFVLHQLHCAAYNGHDVHPVGPLDSRRPCLVRQGRHAGLCMDCERTSLKSRRGSTTFPGSRARGCTWTTALPAGRELHGRSVQCDDVARAGVSVSRSPTSHEELECARAGRAGVPRHNFAVLQRAQGSCASRP